MYRYILLLLSLIPVICYSQLDPVAVRQTAQTLSNNGRFTEAAAEYKRLADFWSSQAKTDSAFTYRYFRAHHIGLAGQNARAIEMLSKLESDIAESRSEPRIMSKLYYSTGSNYLYRNDFDNAQKYLQQAIDFELRQPDTDTLYLAKATEWKGLVYNFTGDLDKAIDMVEEALRLNKSALPKDDKHLGYTLNSLGVLYDEKDNLRKADSVYREAFRVLSLHLPKGHSHLSSISSNISNIKVELGEFDAARDLLEEAISIHKEQELYEPLMKEYYNMGSLYLSLDDAERAIPYVLKAMQIADSLLPMPHYARSNFLNGLGGAYYIQEEYTSADSVFRLALEQNKLLYEPDNPEIGQNYYNLGLIAQAIGKHKEAGEYYKRSYDIRKGNFGSDNPRTVDAWYGMADIEWQTGNKSRAMTMMKKSMWLYEKSYGPQHQSVVEASLFIARKYHELGNSDSTKKYIDLTWAFVCGEEPGEMDYSGDEEISFRDSFVLLLIDFQLETLIDADSDIPTVAWLMDRMDELMHELWPFLNFESANADLLRNIQRIYNLSAYLIQREENLNSDEELQNMILSALEKTRSSAVRSVIQNRSAMRFANVPDSVLERDRKLREELRFIRAKQEEGDPDYWKELEFENIEAWREYQREMKENYPKWYELRYEEREVDVAEIQSRLGDASLVGYYYLDTLTLAVVVGSNSFDSFLIKSDELASQIERFRNSIETRGTGDSMGELAYGLYEKLLEPIDDKLSERLIIMPDGPLYSINFESLLKSRPDNGQFREWDWLLKSHEILFANTLPRGNDRSQRPTEVMAFVPAFTKEVKDSYQKLVSENGGSQQNYPSSLGGVSMPWSESFARSIEGSGRAFVGLEAHEQNFQEHANEAGLLHFGTHAVLNDTAPLNSYLALIPRPDLNVDGYLHAHELYNQPLRAQMAVLTACETGLGTYSNGEGVLSLAHAFQYAGCPNVVYSLWQIDDQQSAQIVESFYQELRNGKEFSTALRQAKINYLESAPAELTAPYYWSGIVLTGQNGKLEEEMSYWWWLLAAAGLVIIIVVGRKVI